MVTGLGELVTEQAVAVNGAGQEAPPQDTTPPTPELAAALARAEAAEQRARSAEGRLSGRGVAAEVQGLRTEVQRLTREMRRGQIEANTELEPEEKRRSLETLSQQERQAAEQQLYTAHGDRLRTRLNRRLATAGLGVENPQVQQWAQRWKAAQTGDIEALDDAYDEIDEAIDQHMKQSAETAITQARQRANRESGTLETGAPPGAGSPAGSGGGDQGLVNRLARGETLSTAEIARAREAMGRGIYPEPART